MNQNKCFTINDRLILTVESASHLASSDLNGYSDPFVDIILNKYLERRTKIIKKNLNPIWNDTFVFYYMVNEKGPVTLDFEIYDWDRFTRNDFLGRATLALNPETTERGKSYSVELPLKDAKSGSLKIRYKVECYEPNKVLSTPEVPSLWPVTDFKFVTDQPFSQFFRPCIPKEFVLVSGDTYPCKEESFNTVFMNPQSGDVISITYHHMGPHVSFVEAEKKLMDEYLKSLKDGALKSPNGMFEIICRDEDVTHNFSKCPFTQAFESRCLTTSAGQHVICVCLTCGYACRVLINYVWISHGFILPESKYSTLLQVATRSEVQADSSNIEEPPTILP
ncbi:hypothetical protein C9374_013300 [Naegleria lovaniensis]|uniref:C2 domain-containing protein n=1 Tax=Naegleria lovaniensis TaxID=51637 RepID=A0AA88GZ04_NAELO|nr:uncharacterized protein C9374_013300 [Naegleria lovaniensis]KAG2391815.1 hypothetical protein C9374_013300 [Naegleria lovaniensis]